MKLFLYYGFCSVKNQIRKMFRSWVAIFLGVCILLGLVLGVGIGLLSSLFEKEPAPDDPAEAPEETVVPDDDEEGWEIDPEQLNTVLELAAGGVILLVLFFNLLLADKNGSAIFLMPDVNLLFSAPMKPQSVLLFRLMSQIFLTLFASVYLLFQLPNLILNFGMTAPAALSMLLVWILTLIYGKLLNVLVYTVSSTHVWLKKYIRPFLYAVVLLLAGGFYLYYRSHAGLGLLGAADGFFNAGLTRWIPVYGWLKGLIFWTIEGAWLHAGISLLLLVGGIVLLAFSVWNIKADFYEDAMAKSQETAERMAAMQSGTSMKRKKDRKDNIARDGLNFGSGAQMFFCKTIYNRFRFATLKIFTKTSIFYLVIGVSISVLMTFVTETAYFPVIGLVLCAAVFFRSLGNPLATDVSKDYFITVPANPYAKVIWSLLGGTVDCALDLLPALAVSAVILHASPMEVIAYFLLALGLDFYSSNIMLFMELSLPTSLALQIKQAISILFIYFGIMPIAAVVMVGAFLNLYLPFLFIAAIAAASIGGVFYAFSPLFLLRGRK